MEKKRKNIMDIPSGRIVGCRLVRRFSECSILLLTKKKKKKTEERGKKYNSVINACLKWDSVIVVVAQRRTLFFFLKYKRRLIYFFFKNQSKMSLWNLQQTIPKRYLLSLLAFFGFFNAYILRSNLSIAIIPMVKPTIHISSYNISITQPVKKKRIFI